MAEGQQTCLEARLRLWAIRTPFGRYGGALSSVRADDLGAFPLRALMARNPNLDWAAITDVIFGCANQPGEDNRNVARMSSLLAGLPLEGPGATVNRLCGSGLDAIGTAGRAIKAGEATLMIAGGVESMSRAPFVMPKANSNRSCAPTARPRRHDYCRQCQRCQRRRLRAAAGRRSHRTKHGLTPRARIVGMATAGVAPRIMGIGPAPATQKVLALTGLKLAQLYVIELNEAFAAQGLAVLRMLGLQDADARVNAWGGAIALGHPCFSIAVVPIRSLADICRGLAKTSAHCC